MEKQALFYLVFAATPQANTVLGLVMSMIVVVAIV